MRPGPHGAVDQVGEANALGFPKNLMLSAGDFLARKMVIAQKTCLKLRHAPNNAFALLHGENGDQRGDLGAGAVYPNWQTHIRDTPVQSP